jgi:hypothetical protein
MAYGTAVFTKGKNYCVGEICANCNCDIGGGSVWIVVLKLFWMECVDVVSSDICNKDREKYDDVRSISRMNTVILN